MSYSKGSFSIEGPIMNSNVTSNTVRNSFVSHVPKSPLLSNLGDTEEDMFAVCHNSGLFGIHRKHSWFKFWLRCFFIIILLLYVAFLLFSWQIAKENPKWSSSTIHDNKLPFPYAVICPDLTEKEQKRVKFNISCKYQPSPGIGGNCNFSTSKVGPLQCYYFNEDGKAFATASQNTQAVSFLDIRFIGIVRGALLRQKNRWATVELYDHRYKPNKMNTTSFNQLQIPSFYMTFLNNSETYVILKKNLDQELNGHTTAEFRSTPTLLEQVNPHNNNGINIRFVYSSLYVDLRQQYVDFDWITAGALICGVIATFEYLFKIIEYYVRKCCWRAYYCWDTQDQYGDHRQVSQCNSSYMSSPIRQRTVG